MVNIICAICKTVKARKPSEAKSVHGSNYCSRECSLEGRKLGLTKRVVSKPYTVSVEGRKAQEENGRSRKGIKRSSHKLSCTFCKKDFECPNWGRQRKSGYTYCSLECCNSHRVGINNPSWKGGHPKYYGSNWQEVRRQVWKRDNCACQRCGVIPANRKPDVHHIIPIYNFSVLEDANTLNNLVCLCHSCHMYVEHHSLDFTPKF